LLWFGLLGLTALHGAACSTSFQLGDAQKKQDDEPVHTGSIAGPERPSGAAVAAAPVSAGTRPASGEPVSAELEMPPAADLAFAESAAREALSHGGKDKSFPWQNPASGARGTITPLSSSYRVDGSLCRDFLASYVARGEETWLQGEACRVARGQWEVRRMKPWRRT
jgi:surface antigen